MPKAEKPERIVSIQQGLPKTPEHHIKLQYQSLREQDTIQTPPNSQHPKTLTNQQPAHLSQPHLRNRNLIPNKRLRTSPLPPPRPRRRNHEPTRRIDPQRRDDPRPRGARDDQERHGPRPLRLALPVLCARGGVLQIIQPEDIVASTHQVPAVRHRSYGGDGARYGGEAQRAGGAPVPRCFVDVEFLDDAIPPASVDGVPGGGPARRHAPGRHAALGRYPRDGVGRAAVPDADGAVY